MNLRCRVRVLRTVLPLAVAVSIGSAQVVIDSVNVGGAWVGGMVYNSRADVVCGNSESGGLFFAIACSTNRVIRTWSIAAPGEAAYDSTDSKVYVAYGDNSVMVVDGATHWPLRSITVAGFGYLVWDAQANRLYASGGDYANEVTVIDCQTDSVVAHIPVGNCPMKMHLNTLHRKLYVQNYDDCSVSIVDLDTNQVIRTIPLGSEPQSGYYCEWAGKYYCDGGIVGGGVAVIDGAGDSVVARIPLPPGTSANAIAGASSSSRVMVAAYGGGTGTVHAVDPGSDSVVATVPVGRNPRALLWSPMSDLVYCANGTTDNLTALRSDGSAVVATLAVGDAPFVLVCSPATRRAYVGHLNSRWVYVVRDELGVSEGPAGVPGRGQPRTTVLVAGALRADGPGLLVDVSGREVLKLVVGENDLSRLTPGVYAALWSDGRRHSRVVKTR